MSRKHRGPNSQSEIIHCPFPIVPWNVEPLPDENGLLIYAKNGQRPQLLEPLAEACTRRIRIHDGRYRREELFEAGFRSRACTQLTDDNHGALALQEILQASCPTVSVQIGEAFVRHGETGVIVDRLSSRSLLSGVRCRSRCTFWMYGCD